MFSGQDPFWSEPRSFSKAEAWIDLLQLARYEPGDWGTGSEVIRLRRAETRPLSRAYLAVRWGWGEKAVRGYLGRLQNMARIRANQSTSQGPTYVIVNYDTYQPGGPASGQEGAVGGASVGPGEGPALGHKERNEEVKHGSSEAGKDSVEPDGSTALVRRGDYEVVKAHIAEVLVDVEASGLRRAKKQALRLFGAEVAFAYWQAVLNHPKALWDPTDKRARALVWHLTKNGMDLSELCYAIDGWKKDPTFQRMAGEGNVLDQVTNIFTRDRDRIERLAGHMKGYRQGQPHRLLREKTGLTDVGFK